MTTSPNTIRNIVLVHGGFVDGSGWEGVYDDPDRQGLQRHRRPEPDHLARRRRRRHEARDRRAGRPGHPRRPFLWRRRHHRSGQRPEGEGARLHRRLRARRRRVGLVADRQPAAGRAGAADPAAAGRLPVPRPRQVRRLVRRRRRSGQGRLHGRLAGALGRRGARRRGHRAGLEGEAELVPGRHRRPHDPAAGAARHGRAGRRRGDRRPAAATPSTCRSRRPSPRSSKRRRRTPSPTLRSCRTDPYSRRSVLAWMLRHLFRPAPFLAQAARTLGSSPFNPGSRGPGSFRRQ